MIVVSSPSGAGKSTLTRALLDADPQVRLSVSATTRPQRTGEEDGVHYHFVDDARFDQLLAEAAFLEWAPVFDHRYGTLRDDVAVWLDQGLDVIFDIDWQGARQLSEANFARMVSIFVLPPSLVELERRLRARAADSDAVIQRRMAKAVDEISHWAEYGYVLVNDDLPRAKTALQAVVTAERAQAAAETSGRALTRAEKTAARLAQTLRPHRNRRLRSRDGKGDVDIAGFVAALMAEREDGAR